MTGIADRDGGVRISVLRQTIDRGAVPTAAGVAAALGLSRQDVLASFERLGADHVFVLDPRTREVLMANPFSAVPTPFVVRSGQRQWWGNCIWDALGIPAIIAADAEIDCACGDCGEPMTVAVRDGAVAGEGIIHIGVPFGHWWDDIVYT
ncbi:MAG: organomercurial lyase [Tepidiformaceae bacterium]